ncbi:MAG: class I SAM-dependent methyltransferase [Terriglobia bacterium]
MDYGCGSGENSIILTALGAAVTGIDLSPHLIDSAKRRMEINRMRWRVRVASAYTTGEPGNSFDIVFGAAILHHLNLEEASREVFRILKPGGTAIFSEPIRDLVMLRWVRRIVPLSVRNASPGEYPLTRAKIEAFCSGFEMVNSRRFSSPWGRLLSRFGHNEHLWVDRADAWFNENVTGKLAAFEVFKVRKPA